MVTWVNHCRALTCRRGTAPAQVQRVALSAAWACLLLLLLLLIRLLLLPRLLASSSYCASFSSSSYPHHLLGCMFMSIFIFMGQQYCCW